LLRRLYGPKSERVHPDQLLLFADDTDAPKPESSAPAEPSAAPTAERPAGKRRCRPHGRRPLPENLPRRALDHELAEAERICACGRRRLDIGTEVTEQLDWQPACYFVWQHRTHKYLCPHCAGVRAQATMTPADETSGTPTTTTDLSGAGPAATPAAAAGAAPAIGPAIITAPKPAMPIAKGLPGPGLLAHIIVSKYFDHLPLYRQEHIFQRHGLVLNRSTTGDWMAACAERLRPLYDLMVTVVLQSVWLHTDDTPVQNRRHDPGATPTGRFWLYYGDRAHPYNVFDFTVNRKRDGPQTFLADFHGYRHADAFSGYDALYLPDARAGTAPIQEVACNAHARRKFYEARGSDSLAAHRALAYYGQLYELEAAATRNGFDDAQRLALRQDLAVPILEKFHTWLEEQRGRVLPKSPMAEAVGYALHNGSALIRYTEAGFLAIDNNVAEREMKRIAIGRKNWLFVGSAKGGHTAAVLFSFTSTCARLQIEPWAYLQDVLTHLPRMPAADLAELLPDRWRAARPRAVSASLGTEDTSAAPDPGA